MNADLDGGTWGITVEFYVDGNSIGSAPTDNDGHAEKEYTPQTTGDFVLTAQAEDYEEGTADLHVSCPEERAGSPSNPCPSATPPPPPTPTPGPSSTPQPTSTPVPTPTPQPTPTPSVSVDTVDGKIWWFGRAVPNHPAPLATKRTATVTNVSSGTSITWRINGQSDIVNFSNNEETMVTTSTSVEIHTIGFSSQENNLTISVTVNGGTYRSSSFTASTVAVVPAAFRGDSPLGVGWQSAYIMTAKDKFNNPVLGCEEREVFDHPGSWPKDGNCNWPPPGYSNNYTNVFDGTFPDNYRAAVGALSPYTPATVNPGQPGSDTPTMHDIQRYRFGGTYNQAGYDATGMEAEVHTVQFYRGKGRQQ